MFLKITTTHIPATDIGYLLHKHPEKLQSFDFVFGKVYVYYPVSTETECTVCMLMDINPVNLARKNRDNNADFSLANYVNDRPYVASSIMSSAISKVFSSALNGQCKKRPELTEIRMPFQIEIPALPARKGGEMLIRRLFEPLGYQLIIKNSKLDPVFPEWGDSRYYSVMMNNQCRLSELLSHLYVLLPVLDHNKHYWISKEEVEKLLEKGKGWLKDHPEKEQITKRYLQGIRILTSDALSRLTEEDDLGEKSEIRESDQQDLKTKTLNQQRLMTVLDELKKSGKDRVADLGCGEGKLIKMLLKEKQFSKIMGLDVSLRSLGNAKKRLYYDDMPSKQKERIVLCQGSLTYRDKRLSDYDAFAVVEVIEHLDPDRLKAFERVIFEFSKPEFIILSTPNKEYNVKYEDLESGQMRHADHRFEWTRKEFACWADAVASKYGYVVEIKPVGEVDEVVGASTQLAVFNLL